MISPLLATQCAKCPRPRTNVKVQVTIACPVVQWLAVMSQATRASNHPATTPLQKTVEVGWVTLLTPRETRVERNSGRSADVRVARTANANDPARFPTYTSNHSRNVCRRYFLSVNTSTTG